MTRAALALAFALALALGGAGCVENVKDYQDRIEADSHKGEAAPVASANATPLAPPVARIVVLAADGTPIGGSAGALVVPANVTLTLDGASSRATAPANLAAFSWDVAGDARTGTRTTARFDAPGRYPVTLTVTDDHGGKAQDARVLVVPAQPYNVTANLTTGPIAGSMGSGQDGTAAFHFDAPANTTVLNMHVVVAALDSCDAVLQVLSGGKAVASADKGGLGSEESVDLPLPAGGEYTIDVGPGDACVAKDGASVQVVLTELPSV